MEKIISKIAGFGVPGLILLLAINATGLAGAAAITTALAALGPGGIVGGIAFLGLTGLIVEAISEYGFQAIYTGVVKQLFVKGETKESIIAKIKKYPLTSPLKAKLISEVENLHY